jgi:hypothetical protein
MTMAQWAFKFGRIYGVEVPDAIRADDVRLKELLERNCQGPYDDTGVQMGFAVYFEGGGVSIRKFGVRIDPFNKGIVSAGIYLRRAQWDRPIKEYRRLLWDDIIVAINGCLEKLRKKQMPFDSEKLFEHLASVESSYFGFELNDRKSKEMDSLQETKCPEASIAEEDHDEQDSLIIQYRIEGHGRASDHDKRVTIENLLGEFLGDADLGYCDGGDIGSGTINVFCFVKPVRGVGQKVINLLQEKDLLEGATIAETINGEERVIWPLGFVGEFQLMYS